MNTIWIFLSQLVDNIRTKITWDARHYLQELNRSFRFSFAPEARSSSAPVDTCFFAQSDSIFRGTTVFSSALYGIATVIQLPCNTHVVHRYFAKTWPGVGFWSIPVQVSLDNLDSLVAKNPSDLSRIRIKEGYFNPISRIRRPKIVRVIEGPTYRSPTNRGTPVDATIAVTLSIVQHLYYASY